MKRVHVLVVVMLGIAVPGGTSAAQHVSPAGIAAVRADSLRMRRDQAVMLRVLGGAGGALLGGAGAGLLGYWMTNEPDCSGCHYSGMNGALIGAGIGSLLGAGIAAAAPRFGTSCSWGSRFGRAMLGAVPGAVAGLVAAEYGGSAFAYPVGVGLGAGLVAGRCDRRR